MPRLPDLDSLGARPVPQGPRGTSSVRNAGAVADAAAQLGGQIAQIGQGMIEKQDKLNYAAARASLLKADVQARQELQDDPDYETYGARYTEKMKAARDAAAGMIKSNSDRALFQAESNVDVERGLGEVNGLARGKRNTARFATAISSLDSLHDVAAGALDEETRLATVKNAGDVIQGLVDQGVVDQARAVELRQNWSKGYVTQQVNGYVERDDPDGAMKALEAGKGMVDWQTFETLKGAIVGRQKTHLAIQRAYDAVGMDAANEDGPTVNYADPLRGKGTGVSSVYGADRGNGKRHNGVDFTGRLGTPIYPIAAGVVTSVGSGGDSGNHVIVTHPDGTTSSYSHMNGIKVKVGEEISPDTELGGIGMTGHTTGPHVHVVVKKGGATVDPQTVIGKAAAPNARIDLNSGYEAIDARANREGWSLEEREDAKGQLDRIVARRDKVIARQEDEAQRAAERIIDERGDGFTDISQLGSIASQLPPGALTTYRNLAERNAKGKDNEPGSDRYFDLLDMSGNPARQRAFLSLTPAQLRDGISKEEYSRLRTMQINMQNEGPSGKNQLQTERIWSAVNRIAPQAGFNLDGVTAKQKPERIRLKNMFYDKLLAAVRARGGNVNDVELEGLARGLAQQVYAVGSDKPAPLYTQTGRVKVGVPQAFYDRVVSSRKQRGLAAWSNEQIRNFWIAEGAPSE